MDFQFKTIGICVCIRNTFVKTFHLYVDSFCMYRDQQIFVWIASFIYKSQNASVNPSVHLWVLPCAFINFQTVLMPYERGSCGASAKVIDLNLLNKPVILN